MTDKQPTALRLADQLYSRAKNEASRRNKAYDVFGTDNTPESAHPLETAAAAELRRLHLQVKILTETLERCKEINKTTAKCWRGDVENYEELLRQAVEALECSDWYMGQLESIAYSHDDTGPHDARAKVQSTISALRERLGEKA